MKMIFLVLAMLAMACQSKPKTIDEEIAEMEAQERKVNNDHASGPKFRIDSPEGTDYTDQISYTHGTCIEYYPRSSGRLTTLCGTFKIVYLGDK